MSGWAFVLFLSFIFGSVARSEEKPQRIVSLNLCVDQILIDLVDKKRIAALSFLATDQAMSAVADRAENFPRVRGSAEGVLSHNPDLVIAGAYSTPATRNLLQRLGRRVEVVQQPTTVGGVRELILKLAGLVGAPQRGREMVAAFDKKLQDAAKLIPRAGNTDAELPSALAIHVNSIVSMPNTLLDDALSRAGFRNAAQDMTSASSGRVSLEALVRHPPDVLVFANTPSDFRTVLADNLHHPVLKSLSRGRPVVTLPMWATLCGTPYVATAVDRLSAARQQYDIQAGRSR